MTIPDECYNMFLDRSNFLYCAATFSHQVVKRWLGSNDTTSTRVADTGGTGAGADALNLPDGISVDACVNNCVQKFELGRLDAVTVAGSTASGTINLNCPNGVILDANGYLFISDTYNNRLIGSGPLGFRCVFGYSGNAGSSLT
jgi:hypothetical protein